MEGGQIMCVCFEKEGMRTFETHCSMIFLGIGVVSIWVETQLERLRGDISCAEGGVLQVWLGFSC